MKEANVNRKCNFGERLLEYDRFGQSYVLNLDQGKDTLPSKMGTFCSILLLMILITYTGYKVNILEAKKSVDILQAVSRDHFDDEYVFGAEQGFNIAIAVFSSVDTLANTQIDPRYGKIFARAIDFQFIKDGVFGVNSYTELKPHQCSMEELGLVGTDHKFFPINEKQKRVFL